MYIDAERALKPISDILLDVCKGNTSDANHFKANIRRYNLAFAMASINSNLTTLQEFSLIGYKVKFIQKLDLCFKVINHNTTNCT